MFRIAFRSSGPKPDPGRRPSADFLGQPALPAGRHTVLSLSCPYPRIFLPNVQFTGRMSNMQYGYYKISPEVKEFILQEAKTQPELGCRRLVSGVEEKFKLKISKSSISTILKEAGLNKPVGRSPNKESPVACRLSPAPCVEAPLCSAPVSREELKEPVFSKVLGIKFILEDNSFFFLDAQLQTVWAGNHIPGGFSLDLSQVKSCLNESILGDEQPLILQVVPDFEEPPQALRDFLACFQAQDKSKTLQHIELYREDQGLSQALNDIPQKKIYFILAAWPWQYKDRSIFNSLRTIVPGPHSPEGLILVTNLKQEQGDDARVRELYFKRWPDPEKSYQELLDKILLEGRDRPPRPF